MSKLPPKIQLGDRVLVQGWPPVELEVVDTSDQALVTLRTPSGATLRVGRLSIVLISNSKNSLTSTRAREERPEQQETILEVNS